MFAYSATNGWVQEKKIRAVDVTAQAYFGASVALGEEYWLLEHQGITLTLGLYMWCPGEVSDSEDSICHQCCWATSR